MKDKNFIIIVFLLSIVIIIFTTLCIFKNNKYETNTTIQENNSNIKVDNEIINDSKKTNNQKEETKKEEVKKEKKNKTNTIKEDYTSNDLKVIDEIEDIRYSLKESFNYSKNKDFKEKCKGVFITLVDFVFFDGKINDVTFDELSDKGKTKVLSLINSIDNYIENKYPKYKEEISQKSEEAFKKASSLIKKGINELSEVSKEKLGEDNYKRIISSKDDLVKYTKSASNIVKNTSIKIYDTTKDKLKEWYTNFKKNKNEL